MMALPINLFIRYLNLYLSTCIIYHNFFLVTSKLLIFRQIYKKDTKEF